MAWLILDLSIFRILQFTNIFGYTIYEEMVMSSSDISIVVQRYF